MKPFPKDRFRIGDWVRVDASVEFRNGKPTRREHSNMVGQIVGVALRCHGERKKETYNWGEYGEDYQPAYLDITETEYVWLVRLGMTNKPFEALNDDVEGCWGKRELPFRYSTKVKWTEADKQELRDIMIGVPRDAKGRWIK